MGGQLFLFLSDQSLHFTEGGRILRNVFCRLGSSMLELKIFILNGNILLIEAVVNVTVEVLLVVCSTMGNKAVALLGVI